VKSTFLTKTKLLVVTRIGVTTDISSGYGFWSDFLRGSTAAAGKDRGLDTDNQTFQSASDDLALSTPPPNVQHGASEVRKGYSEDNKYEKPATIRGSKVFNELKNRKNPCKCAEGDS
jgi:hypothetical protein